MKARTITGAFLARWGAGEQIGSRKAKTKHWSRGAVSADPGRFMPSIKCHRYDLYKGDDFGVPPIGRFYTVVLVAAG